MPETKMGRRHGRPDKTTEKEGADVVMGVDANAATDEENFGEMAVRQGLIDLIAIQHGQTSLETFMEGTKQ